MITTEFSLFLHTFLNFNIFSVIRQELRLYYNDLTTSETNFIQDKIVFFVLQLSSSFSCNNDKTNQKI